MIKLTVSEYPDQDLHLVAFVDQPKPYHECRELDSDIVEPPKKLCWKFSCDLRVT